MNELTKASIELLINDQVALSIESDVEIGKQQLQSFHPEAHYYSDPQFRLFKTDAGWNIEHDETAINETMVNGIALAVSVLITDGMVISVGNAAKGIQKLPIIFKLSICSENNNDIIKDEDSDEWSDDDEYIDLKNATRDEVLTAVFVRGSALKYADLALKADREVVLVAVSNDGSALEWADDTLKADREIVLAAVSNNKSALECADDAQKIDRELGLFTGNSLDDFKVINLKLGYTQGELSEDFEDFEDAFNAPKHVYWKFTVLEDKSGELDRCYLLIDWKNSKEYPLSSDEEVSHKIGEICSATTLEMFGSVIVLGAFESVVISGLDDTGYECVNNILEKIGGYIEVDEGIQIPEENVNSLFCLHQEIQEGIVTISNGSMLINEKSFDIDGDYEAVSKVVYFTEDVMNIEIDEDEDEDEDECDISKSCNEKTKTIYIKAEPSGEIILGRLPDDEVKILKKMHQSDQYKDTDLFVANYSNYCDLGQTYGIFLDISSSYPFDESEKSTVEYNHVKSISFPRDDEGEPLDGFYICYSGLSKMSVELEIELPLGEEFNANKITVDYTDVYIDLLESDMYGEYCFSVANEYYYDNKPIKDQYGDNFELVDRGISNEFFILQIKSGEYSTIFHLDSNGESEWEDFL